MQDLELLHGIAFESSYRLRRIFVYGLVITYQTSTAESIATILPQKRWTAF